MGLDTWSDQWMMPALGLVRLVDMLVDRFDEVIGPVAIDGVIRLRPIRSASALPKGLTDQQEAASYGLLPSDRPLRFGYVVGPDSLKAIVHPPRAPVWTMRRRDGTLVVDPALEPSTRRAVIGVRACDLRALAVLERTQTDGPHPDPTFVAARDGLFTVAVDCTRPQPTCFCGSAGDGPVVDRGHDIALTELDGRDGPTYLVRVGSPAGREVVDRLHLGRASVSLVERAHRELGRAARELVRELPAEARTAVGHPDHPRWDEVARRCLACGNCTAVCPTCFCTDMDDRIDLDGETSTRDRVWDTCFSLGYSQLGPAPHRASPMARYRQWLTHKIGTWHDQFGESGCVGCGRCITWCPVGIDLTAELESLARPTEARS